MEDYIKMLDSLETKLNENGEMSVNGFANPAEFFGKLEDAQLSFISKLETTPSHAKKFTDFYGLYKNRFIERTIPGHNATRIHRSFKFDTLLGLHNLPTVTGFYVKIADLNRMVDSYASEILLKKSEMELGQEACIKLNMDRHQFFDLLMKLRDLQVNGKPGIEIINAKEAGKYFSNFMIDSENQFLNPGTVKNYLTNTTEQTRQHPSNQLYIIDRADELLLRTYKKSLTK